ncbi:DapH/DapD/GlmU-related protein [Lutibacter sp. HS1-25]|uniref:acyltransferase n=1 Tax=Lutibacter sp. HS1-25 TaxID=2485000 RepID=UPI0013E953F4|nr:acyltransferase [Lutibacter sp. HS1-25]
MKSCGDDVIVRGPCNITGVGKVSLGNNVTIGANAYIKAEGGLIIGNNVSISRNLVLYTINHNYKGKRLPYDESQIKKQVVIEDNVWIGMNVCITPGSHIEEGAIIGMGTTVTGRVPARAIIGSQSWRVLKYRDEEHYNKLISNSMYGDTTGRKYP